jgi:stage II sporulation protein D
LKAQAVLTQSRLAKMKLNTPLSDTTQDESFLGMGPLRPEVQKAVLSVWNQVLTYEGRPISALYHSTCAGHTSSGSFFSGHHTPYLTAVKCDYCKASPFWSTTVTQIPRPLFFQSFGPKLPQITAWDDGHRPLWISMGNAAPTRSYAFWMRLGQKFGWDKAPGTKFDIHAKGMDYIEIHSRGAGHGVGLCQWGAAGQARKGRKYDAILHYYFPQTHLTRLGS